MLEHLRALTMWQPWGSAIMAGVKPWENRPWAPRRLRGQPMFPLWVALHAGLTIDKGMDWDLLSDLWPGQDCRRDAGWPRGALLGLVRFDRAVSYEPGSEAWDSRWAFGPWCWRVGEVLTLAEPIPCRGLQGLWPVPEEHLPTFRELHRTRSP